MAQAVALARDLSNMPGSVKTPAWLAERATEQGVTARVWDEEQLKADGFGGIVAVGMGSVNPPRLIQLSYTPAEPATRHVVLVGKGITFDSGGLSLKPTANMKTQKTDTAAPRSSPSSARWPSSALPSGSPASSPRPRTCPPAPPSVPPT